MRSEEIVILLHNLRRQKESDFFNTPPDPAGFEKRLGIWMGIGEALNAIEDARKKETDDD